MIDERTKLFIHPREGWTWVKLRYNVKHFTETMYVGLARDESEGGAWIEITKTLLLQARSATDVYGHCIETCIRKIKHDIGELC